MSEVAKKEDRKRCPMCSGRGYLNCDCWPGDCICGYGDETCDECEGHGWFYPEDPEWDEI